jgi:hypothetical protein
MLRFFFASSLAVVVVEAADTQRLRLTEFGAPPPETEVRGLLASICPNGIVADPGLHGFAGCRTCPQFTSAPDWQNWSVVAVHYGHFSDPAAEEAAVATSGCEPHSMKWGGTALFRRDGAKWKLKWYHRRLIINDCVMVRRKDGRDLLVCSDVDGGQGTNWRTLSVVDLAQPARFREKVLLTVTDNLLTCGGWGNSETIVPIQKGVFTDVAFDRAHAVLEAKIEYGWRRITAEGSKACSDAQNAHRKMPARLRPVTKIYGLSFDFDGEKFHITPEGSSHRAERHVVALRSSERPVDPISNQL